MFHKKYFFIYLFVLFGFLFSFYTPVFAGTIDHIVFINDPQTVVVGTSSSEYQIQLQDASGVAATPSATVYVTFPVASGDFFSTGGNILSATTSYIATNSSNKYFYFVPHTIGDMTLKILVRNAKNSTDTTQEWEADQVVHVIAQNTTDEETQATTTESATSTDITNTENGSTTTQITTITRYVSVHASPEDLSNYTQTPSFGVSAGRNRLVSLGTPILFVAEKQISDNLSGCNPSFTWSFGDGFSAQGESISHIYRHDGTYEVVLNSSCGNVNAVARSQVRVFIPHIILTATSSDSITVTNTSQDEINVGGWNLSIASSSFIFPNDTIIGVHKHIILDSVDLPFPIATGSQIDFVDPSGNVVATTSVKDSIAATSTDVFNQIESPQQESVPTEQVLVSPKILEQTSSGDASSSFEGEKQPVSPSINQIQTATTGNALPESSFWQKLIHAPINGLKSILSTFYREK